MSAQFGRWSFGGAPSTPDYLEKARELLAPYGPDGGGFYSGPGVDILYSAFHTTKESTPEQQPHQSPSGAILTWDGRLDNREELTSQLGGKVTLASTDVAVVAAAYEQWGTKSLAKLIGDWALSIWEPRVRALILAKDFVGTRHLYYARDNEQAVWSTTLDPLVLLAARRFSLDEQYLAGWLTFFPAPHLTPYVGIHAVAPSTFTYLSCQKETVVRYWNFDAHKQIRYPTDAEYEEHFRTAFGESVRRRLRSNAPVLAELSGGVDSSSIVCMADSIISARAAPIERLDTVSYYSESEPNWNERPYFRKVEERRGRTGRHIDVSSPAACEFENDRLAATPAHIAARPTEASRQFTAYLASRGSRIVLSGIGGDEVTGGIPSPTPELEDLLRQVRVKEIAHRLKTWALSKRRPWFGLLLEAVRRFVPSALEALPKHAVPPSWLRPDFVKRQRQALTGYPSRIKIFGPLPSFQENLLTLQALQRQLGTSVLPFDPPYEMRYPYLDRDLLEFLYAIPREQLVRPGQRRSLMRRAMAGIVPAELLNRRRKAFATRTPAAAIAAQFAKLIETSGVLVGDELGIVDARRFSKEPDRARYGHDVPVVNLMRMMQIEFWLRALDARKLVTRLVANSRSSSENAALSHAATRLTPDRRNDS